MIHFIGNTKNGTQVHVDLINSEAAINIARQPQLLNLVREVITKEKLTGNAIELECDMGRVIGYDYIIEETSDNGKAVFYARILREEIVTRFIKGARPAPTNYISMTLHRTPDNGYTLHTVRMGRRTPPRPGATNETSESKHYWTTHAVIQEGQVLQPKTITKVCPY